MRHLKITKIKKMMRRDYTSLKVHELIIIIILLFLISMEIST